MIESVHADLLALSTEETPDEAARELTELQARERATDVVHDRKGGGVRTVLDGAAQLAESDEERSLYERVRARLFDAEESVFTANYQAEAGHVEKVAQALEEPETRSTLASIKVRKGASPLDETRAWVKAGRSLGVDESRKVELEAILKEAANAQSVSASRVDNAGARNGWIKTINAVLSTSAILKGKAAESFAPVVREIRAFETKADERATRRRGAVEDGSGESDVVKSGSVTAETAQKPVKS